MYPNLKLKLWSSGIRQDRLAQVLGIDETMLNRMINGFGEASPDVRRRIAALLELEEKWLFAERVPAPELGSRGSSRN